MCHQLPFSVQNQQHQQCGRCFGGQAVPRGQNVGDVTTSNASDVNLSINAGNITGVAAGLLGAGKVTQNIGTISGQSDRDINLSIQLGNVSGTGVGVLGKGSSVEQIGAISATNASNINLSVAAGDITSSAGGSGSSSTVSLGNVHRQQCQQ